MTDEDLNNLRRIEDPVERGRRATELIDHYTEIISGASTIRQEVIDEFRGTMTPAQIARALGLTRARVSQLLKAPASPERPLLAPDAGQPVVLAHVQKRDTDTGKPAIAETTSDSLDKLRHLAQDFGVKAAREPVDPPGEINLNRNNLAVLIGPRISALIAQALTADPVIHWRRDDRRNWFMVDSKTGQEFHSDFDQGYRIDGRGRCIALIGRIRRPDGQGSFLYLGGAHAPGTAGAVDVFIREISSIWEQAKRSPWSAVVTTTASSTGQVLEAELATPIYVHGKR